MLKNNLIDLPVAIIFFNRSDTLLKVFEQVRLSKPSKLFLIQDGARLGNKEDEINIQKCRDVVSNIDWDCEVIKDFSNVNLGCGKRVYSGLTNAFNLVDRLVILEDDCVPSQSMFLFCAQMLDKYKDDERINMISGMNHLESYTPDESSYFFCKTGSIWGWATWKRVWDKYDYSMSFLNDKSTLSRYENLNLNLSKKHLKNNVGLGKSRKSVLDSGGHLSAWTYQFGMLRHLYSQLVIVPKVNLVTNVGIHSNTTHGVNSLKKLPKGLRKVFFLKNFDLKFPLNHPLYIIEDNEYDKKVNRLMGKPLYIKSYRRLEGALRHIFAGDKHYFNKLVGKLFNRNN